VTVLDKNVSSSIEESWAKKLADEFKADYFLELSAFLSDEIKTHTIFPPIEQLFSAFNYTPFEKVKVVIIGQDPYHGQGQANGLCFSVSDEVKKPPSLVNIFKELNADCDLPIPLSGNLESWAKQGVLLLNSTLTVREKNAGSHHKKGWEQFTDKVIEVLSEKREHIVFLLWGRFAQKKAMIVDANKHHILTAAHPSPFSAHNGFLGCRHFSKTNEYLTANGYEAIDWSLE